LQNASSQSFVDMVKAVKQRASSEHAKIVKLKDGKLSINIPEDWGVTQTGEGGGDDSGDDE